MGGRGGYGIKSQALRYPGAYPAREVVSDAPKPLQRIINRSSILPSKLLPGVAGVAPFREKDGSLVIRVAEGRKPSRDIIIHEATHQHQSDILRRNPDRHDSLIRRFEQASSSDRHRLFSPSMSGDEIWAVGAGFRYGGRNRGMLSESSPNVNRLLLEVYGE